MVRVSWGRLKDVNERLPRAWRAGCDANPFPALACRGLIVGELQPARLPLLDGPLQQRCNAVHTVRKLAEGMVANSAMTAPR